MTRESSAAEERALLARLEARAAQFERYEILGELGRGGMGVVQRVRDRDLSRELAMKVIARPLPGAEEERALFERFLEEAQLTGRLDHAGIVPVHELGFDPSGRLYFTMKLVEGRTLKEVFELAAQGAEGWNPTRVLGVLLRACEAVAYAHTKGVVHRDLKPGNVMVGSFGEVYVVDWGLARVLGEGQPPAVHEPREAALATAAEGEAPSSLDGAVIGTPAYMPPEQAAGRSNEVGPHSDVYAMGAMLYHLLAGHMPYADQGGSNALVVWRKVLNGPPAPLPRRVRAKSPELAAICERAMQREPARRYASMGELAADLAAYLEGRVVRAYATGTWAETRKWVRRNPLLAGSLASVFVVLAGGLWLSLSLKKQSDENERKAIDHGVETQLERDRMLGLADTQRAEELVLDAEDLWPAVPGNLARMDAWLARADELTGHLPQHRVQLALLRERLQAEREGVQPLGSSGDNGIGTRWMAEQFEGLIRAIEDLAHPDPHVGPIADVRARAAFARTLEQRSLRGESVQRAWQQACAAIADRARTPQYNGLALAPQLGLVPLGPDPRSGLWEFAQLASGTPPERAADGRLVLREEHGLVLVLLPGGRVRAGAQHDDRAAARYDAAALADEGPLCETELAPFFIAKHELTQAQWLRVFGNNPSTYGPGYLQGGKQTSARHPVESVSWREAMEFARRLGLELPTEAQWEYAARAGTETPWWCGSELPALVAAANLAEADDGWSAHAPVGSFTPNAFGLHDVLGNVAEWCRDEYGSYQQPLEPGEGLRIVGSELGRVVRGGGYDQLAPAARVSARAARTETTRESALGVRLARRVDAGAAK